MPARNSREQLLTAVEDLLTDFATTMRNKISREIITQLKKAKSGEACQDNNPDELMLLFIASRLIAKFKITDPDVEKVMLEAIDREQDLGKLIDGTLLRHYQNVPEDAKKVLLSRYRSLHTKPQRKISLRQKKNSLVQGVSIHLEDILEDCLWDNCGNCPYRVADV